MANIIGISGSLRKASYNTALLKAAAEIAKGEIEIASIAEIPLYNGDIEDKGIPAAVTALQDKLEQADGILIVSPEYNHGVPGVLKNAIDWLSRGDKAPRVFANKPLTVMGATPGGFGTLNAQTAWLTTWRTLRVRVWNESLPLMVPRANTVFDAEGRISDDKLRENLKKHIEGFIDFVKAQKSLGQGKK
jgi:chromate reductase, NAD(P)H dehydrogenase (quinone)